MEKRIKIAPLCPWACHTPFHKNKNVMTLTPFHLLVIFANFLPTFTHPKKNQKTLINWKICMQKRWSSGSLGCVPSSCNNNTEDASVICNLLHVRSLTKSAHLSLLFCCNLLELQMQPSFETIMSCTNASKLHHCMCYYNVPDISLSLSLSLSLTHTHTHTHTHIPKKSWMVESGGISAAWCKP
jgi:hypothetical protein